MSKHLVIVESPAKARTIERYLGKDYKVLASYGHVRQLPSKQGSIDVEHDFKPKYETIPANQKHVTALKKALKDSDELLLATDLDREGEAIAWHLTQLLKPAKEPKRITFHEITKEAITNSLKSPQKINDDLVEAQETRQSLDYLYGFTLSPYLWKKIRYGLSAGRVQSVALRLIVDREREIAAFKPEEYWTLEAMLRQPKEPDERLAVFPAKLAENDGQKLKQFDLTKERAAELSEEIPKHPLQVTGVETKQRKRSPAPPFTTSTLQQEASRKLGFATRRTMRTAQTLYEGASLGAKGSVGLITYMRTDSLNMAVSAVAQARNAIASQYGKEYVPDSPRAYRTKSKGAQEAHEAIRPTSFEHSPDSVKAHLEPDQLKLYTLIWKRALASQMADAQLDATVATISAGAGGKAVLKATGSHVRFAGFIKVYMEGRDEASSEDTEKLLPPLSEGDKLELQTIVPEQHFTQPPPRFTEASLVKTLEEHGIGRPSTYASIISVIQDREYVRLEERRFHTEEIGLMVSDLLTAKFPEFVDYNFTSALEEKLDAVASGQADKVKVLSEWWKQLQGLLGKATAEGNDKPSGIPTGETCPECQKGELLKKAGRYGIFYGCSNYPECKFIKKLEKDAKEEELAQDKAKGEKCPECGGEMVVKRGRFGLFLACARYPECKGAKPIVNATGVPCPKCKKGELAERRTKRGKIFYSCSRYPKCDFASWQEPVKEPCPKCQSLVTKRGKAKIACTACDFEKEIEPVTDVPA